MRKTTRIISFFLLAIVITSISNVRGNNNLKYNNLIEKNTIFDRLNPSGFRILGVVTTKDDNSPMPGANVMIKGTTIGAATDVKGEFVLPKMAPGNYTLMVRFVGYKRKEVTVEVKERSIFIEVEMEYEIIEGDVVEITAQAKGQMDAINQQLNSNKITNIVSSDRLNEIPDANAAESVGRLPGVAIRRSGGEATDVIIRGLQSGYTSVSVDGIKMASTSENRGVGIANISPNMLDGIELAKAITPDMDGDATAGAINFKLKQAPSGLQMNAFLQGGFSSYDNSYGMPKVDLNFSNRFFNDKLGIFSQVSFFSANRGTDTFTGSYDTKSDPTETDPFPELLVTSVGLGKHIETRNRYGFSFVADYSLPNGKLFFKNFSSRMTSESINMVNDYNVDYKMMKPSANGYQDVRTDAIVTSLAGEHKVWNSIVDWSISHSYRISEKPNFWNLAPEVLETNMSHDVLLNGNNTHGAKDIPSYLENFNSDILTLRYSRHKTFETKAGEISTKVNMEIPYTFSNMISGKIKFGGKYSRYDRSRFNTENIGYLRKDSDRIAKLEKEYPYLQWNNLDYITMTSFLDKEYSTRDFWNGEYKLYFPIDIELSKEFMTDVKKYSMELLLGRQDNYDNIEQYFAGYVMSEINITNKLTLIPGVRYEKTTHDYNAFYMRLDRVPGLDEPVLEQGEYKNVTSFETKENLLPMFHIKYKPFNWMDIRFAITKTLKRPNYLKLSPRSRVDLRQKRGYFTNPKLKVQEAINIDLHTSFYGNYIGLFTVGGFYKKINNLIYPRNFLALSDSVAQLYHPELKKNSRIYSYDNVAGYKTWVKGIEFEWQTRFWYLPFPLNGLVLNLNFSFMQSETILPSFSKTKIPNKFPPQYINEYVETTMRMPGQTDYLGNVSVGYDYRGFSTRVSALYQGPTYGSNRYSVQNKITEELFRWDVKVTQKLFQGMKLILDFNNITNWPDVRTNEYYHYTIKREQYGWQGSIGVRYSL